MRLVILLKRKERLRMGRRRGDPRKEESRWTPTTAPFVQVQKLRPLFSQRPVGEVSVVHTCVNRDAAERHR